MGKQKLRKNAHNAEEKLKEGPHGIFQHPFCHKTPNKMKGRPLLKILFEKSLAMLDTTKSRRTL